jgi:hypothetical protein
MPTGLPGWNSVLYSVSQPVKEGRQAHMFIRTDLKTTRETSHNPIEAISMFLSETNAYSYSEAQATLCKSLEAPALTRTANWTWDTSYMPTLYEVTLFARQKTGRNLGTRVKQSMYQITQLDYSTKRTGIVTYLSPWMDQCEIMVLLLHLHETPVKVHSSKGKLLRQVIEPTVSLETN